MDITSNVLSDHYISILVAIFNKHSSSEEYDCPMNSFYSTLCIYLEGPRRFLLLFYDSALTGTSINYLSRLNFSNNLPCNFPWPLLWQEEKHCNLSNNTLKISSLISLLSKWIWTRKITCSKENSHIMSKLGLGYKFVMPSTI